MPDYDVLIVGGGPAGSSCARALTGGGRRVAVLDRETFPRTKLCAGWITPDVVHDLELELDDYPHRLNTFDHIVVHIKGMTFKYRTIQHSIRRYEFDDFLLRRSGAEVIAHTVKQIRKLGSEYVIDNAFSARYLVGAGGTRCPVYKQFFRAENPRTKTLQVATLEQEFPYAWSDHRCHLWFFKRRLPGYAWYVPKAKDFLNCGIGGMAASLKQRDEEIKQHWNGFISDLAQQDLVTEHDFDPKGYSYFLHGTVDVVSQGNAFIVGDSAGLASRDLGEGIGPAVQSGLRAARAILTGEPYTLSGIPIHSISHDIKRRTREFIGRTFKLGR